MLRTDEQYLKDKNVWNVREYDTNKLICTSWLTPHTYLIDRNEGVATGKQFSAVIEEKNKSNKHATDLWPLPGYSFATCPYMLKRSSKCLTLIDTKHRQEYMMYEDLNADWGYNKVAIVDRGDDAFEIVYVVSEGKPDRNVIKRFVYPAYYLQGLMKISNLMHRV